MDQLSLDINSNLNLNSESSRSEQKILENIATNKKRNNELQTKVDLWMSKLETDPKSKELVFNWVSEIEKDPDYPEKIKNNIPSGEQKIFNNFYCFTKELSIILIEKNNLISEHLPFAREAYKDKLQNLYLRINYSSILDHYRKVSNNTYGRYSSDDFLDNVVNDISTLDKWYFYNSDIESIEYDDLNYRLDRIQLFESKWKENGFLFDEIHDSSKVDYLNTKESVKEIRRTIEDELSKNISLLETSMKLSQTYKSHIDDDKKLCEFDSYINYFTMLENVLNFDGHNFNIQLLLKIKEDIENMVIQYKKMGILPRSSKDQADFKQQISEINVVDEVNKIKILGFNENIDNQLDIDRLKKIMRYLIPPVVLQKIESIKFEKDTKKKDTQDPNWEQTGEIFSVYEVDNDGLPILKTLNIIMNGESDDRLGEIIHELGHGAHKIMSLDEVLLYEEASQNDPVSVTEYSHKYKKDANDNKWKRENFAESFKLFLTYPAILSVISPSKFQFMFDYFISNLQEDQRKVLRDVVHRNISDTRIIWDREGLSDEDIRKRYLIHE